LLVYNDYILFLFYIIIIKCVTVQS